LELVWIIFSLERLDGVTLFFERDLVAHVTGRVAHFGRRKFSQEATRASMFLFLKAYVEGVIESRKISGFVRGSRTEGSYRPFSIITISNFNCSIISFLSKLMGRPLTGNPVADSSLPRSCGIAPLNHDFRLGIRRA
jgi:hypothetical protein